MFSVGSEAEAKKLLILACSINYDGEFIASELAHEQTVSNLMSFGRRLKKLHREFIKNGWCDCD